jgi:hypothetical protein
MRALIRAKVRAYRHNLPREMEYSHLTAHACAWTVCGQARPEAPDKDRTEAARIPVILGYIQAAV